MGYIYIIYGPNNRNYIGQTVSCFRKRFREHYYDAVDPNKNHCVVLNNAIRKYGISSFTVKELYKCDNSLLNYYEQYYISYFNTIVPNGYNIKPGGSSCTHNELTKEKISKSLMGRTISHNTRLKISKNKNNCLPMYMIYRHINGKVKFRICNHPMGKDRQFSCYSDANDYLTYLNTLTKPDITKKSKNNIKYLQKYKNGYVVKHPDYKNKYFVSNNLTNSEKYELAVNYLTSISTMQFND